MRTLIVDDEPGVRSLAGKVLNGAGSVCEMAATGEEALERLTREHFDIALLDIRLPGMDGLTLARHVQQQHPDISLVMITGATNVESVIAAMQVGAADYVIKPFGADKASQEVRSALIKSLQQEALVHRERDVADRLGENRPPSIVQDKASALLSPLILQVE